MPKKALEKLTESMFYVLMALRGEARCGSEIVSFIDRCTGGRIQIGPATLYTVLSKFEKEKYIREVAVQGRKRTYTLTPMGLSAYEAEFQRLHQCLADAQTAGKEDALAGNEHVKSAGVSLTALS
ncbi:MAG: helix-turn-helix transcriptional regulator [Clostridia bacterium]|nr:helix-turn-helix transcriptional regulator [Clostridia bacterium]